ncbi:MAG: ATP-binding protein [Planctomycetota bacterium]
MRTIIRELRSTIMTSNRPIEEWGKLIGDVPAATAILDRFLHHAQVIAITGRSYRLKDRAVKQAGTKQVGKEDPPAKEKRSRKEEAPCGKDA